MKEHFTFPTDGNPLYHWNMLWGLTNSLKLMLAHADRVIQTMVSMPPDTMIEDNVFYQWCDRGASSVSKITSQMLIDFKKLSETLNQVPATLEYLETLDGTIKTIDEQKEMFIKSPDKSQYQTLLNNIEIG